MNHIDKKIEEINNRNISDEEKQKRIDELYEKEKHTKKQKNKKELVEIVVAFILFFILVKALEYDLGILALCGIFLVWYIFKVKANKEKKQRQKSVAEIETHSLQAMCEDLCNNNREELIKLRNKANTKLYMWLILPWVLLICLQKIMPEDGIYIFLIIYIFIVLVLIKNVSKDYTKIYKEKVIKPFINKANNELYYKGNKIEKSIIKEEYKYIYANDRNYGETKIEIDDYIYGNIYDNIFVEMGDLAFSVRGHRRYRKLFRGYFVTLNLNKNFGEFGIFRNKIFYSKYSQQIETANELFNKYFEIQAENPKDVQTYLTPSLIQFIADFREKYQIDFEIIFKDKIYIRFFTGNMFEPKMFGKIVDEHSVYKFYVITKFAKELVEKLGN